MFVAKSVDINSCAALISTFHDVAPKSCKGFVLDFLRHTIVYVIKVFTHIVDSI